MPYRLLVSADCEDPIPDDSCRVDNVCDWHQRFEQALVDGLNDETDGLGGTHDNDPSTTFRVNIDEVAIAEINRDPDKWYCVDRDEAGQTCTSDESEDPSGSGGECENMRCEEVPDGLFVVRVFFTVPTATVTATRSCQLDNELTEICSAQVLAGVEIASNLQYQLANPDGCYVDSFGQTPHQCALSTTLPTSCIQYDTNSAALHSVLNAQYNTITAASGSTDGLTQPGTCHSDQTTNCGDHATCVNVNTRHTCICDDGFTHSAGQGCTNGQSTVSRHEAVAGLHTFARTMVKPMHDGGDPIGFPASAHDLSGHQYQTFRLLLHLQNGASAAYAIYGDELHPMVVPKAFQSAVGSDVGGVSPNLIAVIQEAEHDSWLTVRAVCYSADLCDGVADAMLCLQVGETGQNTGMLASIGFSFNDWTENNPLEGDMETGSAVFWMDPTRASEANQAYGDENSVVAVVAQLSLRHDCLTDYDRFRSPQCYNSVNIGDQFVSMNAQGKHAGAPDWKESNFEWHQCQFMPTVCAHHAEGRTRLENLCDQSETNPHSILLTPCTIKDITDQEPDFSWDNVLNCCATPGQCVATPGQCQA